ncbi:Aminoglycoside phosphotransferase [Penicillium viridicatum]|nr:Aminoglycoside phosphotransferase [Penicillium viridicatum]
MLNTTYRHPHVKPQSREDDGFLPLDGKDLNSLTDEALVTLLTTHRTRTGLGSSSCKPIIGWMPSLDR